MRVRRPGFTLAEVLVSLSLASLLLVVVYSLFTAGIRHYQRVEVRTEAVLGALVVAESLDRDLTHLMTDKKRVEGPVDIGAGGSTLRLQLARSDPKKLLFVFGHPVDYTLHDAAVPGVRRLRRNGRLIENAYLKFLRFEWIGPERSGSGGCQYLRVDLEATDRLGAESFPFSRLFCLEVPTLLWRQVAEGERRGR